MAILDRTDHLMGKWAAHIERASHKRMLFYMIAMFAAVHISYMAAGVRFDDHPLGTHLQYLDPQLLKTRLLESVFYLHGQPPLFNLFVGLILKLAGGREVLVFHALYLLLGLTLYLSVFLLMVKLSVSRLVALALSTLFMASPSFILYEHWLFYTFPLAVLVAVSALLLHHSLRRERDWPVLCFFGVIFLLGGIRSLFHLLYYFGIVAAMVIVCPHRRKRLLLLSLGPGLLLFLFYFKNLLLFDKFTVSSWTGMNVWTMSARNLPIEERKQLVVEGKLSRVSLVERFSPLELYPSEYLQVTEYEDVPALRQMQKSTGAVNYNHLAYIAISDRYLEDALYVLKHYPQALLKGVARAWFSYFKSSADYELLGVNRDKLSLVEGVYDYLFYGKIPFNLTQIKSLPIYSDRPHYVYVFLLVGLPFVALYALRLALKGEGLNRDQRVLLLYMCVQIIYVAFVGNALEVGENNRFRFMTDPLSLALLGVFVQRSINRFRNRSALCNLGLRRKMAG